MNSTQIKNRRDDILLKMRNIPSMKRGQLTEQTLTRTAADGTKQKRGPYFTLQRWEKGRNRSQRVHADQLPAVRAAVQGYQRFKELSEEFAELTEQLTEMKSPLLPQKKTPRGGLR